MIPATYCGRNPGRQISSASLYTRIVVMTRKRYTVGHDTGDSWFAYGFPDCLLAVDVPHKHVPWVLRPMAAVVRTRHVTARTTS